MVLYSREGGTDMTTNENGWSFDASHSGIGFAVRHLMISKVRGTFDKWTGTFAYDAVSTSSENVESGFFATDRN